MRRRAITVLLSCLGLFTACRQPRRPSRPPRTLVMVVIDTLRRDHLGIYGYRRPTSPCLDNFAKRAEVYDHALAVTSWTRPTVATMLSGLPPELHGAGLALSPLAENIPWAPDLLHRARYRAVMLSASAQTAPQFGFGRGWDAYANLAPADYAADSATPLLVRLRAELAAAGNRDLFVYLQFIDPHTPYAPRGSHTHFTNPAEMWKTAGHPPLHNQTAEADAVIGNRIDRYDGEVETADENFCSVLSALRQAGRADGALIAFTADHGEEFGEHGGFEHGQTLYAEVMQIPLVIRWPGGDRAGLRNDGAVSQLDFLPTLLRQAGVDIPAALTGVALPARPSRARIRLSSLEDGATAMGLNQNGWSYIMRPGNGGAIAEEIYDIDSDPDELHDLATAQPAMLAALRNKLRGMRVLPSAHAQSSITDPALIEKLRQLGYLR